VLAQLHDVLAPSALVISIMAGVTVKTMQQAMRATQPIVRVMPNTPAQLGLGASGWFATSAVTGAQLATARAILGAMGIEAQFDNEYAIDMVTGVSGSGPAFVFLFAEAYIDAAVRIGIARPAAEKLCIQTLKGSVALIEQSGMHPAQLKNQVTSAGGTTAAGLHALERGALRAAVAEAVEAAWRRAQELGAQ
jgi:pyrroline-5-carboxylate reductase